MATNYGYVKQDADSQVNWGQVGKTFTDMLSAENTRRETLKKEIDDNTVTDLERLAQIPKGSSEEYNKWTTDAADKISQARLLQVKELKAGRLSLKDYNNYRQNTVSGVNNMVSTIKSYNAWFENGMKRAEKMESGAAEIWKDSLLESMKFKDTVPNIALDGSMSVTKQIKNPRTGLMEVSTNPADAFSFSSMLDFGKKQFNRFKAAESLDVLSKTVGEYTKVLNQGNVGLVSDMWQKDKSGKFTNPQIGAIQNQVKAAISNPNDAMSVLVDFKGVTPSGGKYEFTNDPNDPRLKGADRENVIFMDSTMSPKLTEGQMKRAEDIMIEGLKARSSHIETQYAKPEPRQYAPKDTSTEAQESTSANMLGKIYSGDENEVNAGLQYFIGLNPDWRRAKVDKETGILSITDKEGITTPIRMKDNSGKLINFSDFAKSASFLTGIKDVNKALQASGMSGNMPYSPSSGVSKRSSEKAAFDSLIFQSSTDDKGKAVYENIDKQKKLMGDSSGGKAMTAMTDYVNSVLENIEPVDKEGAIVQSITSDEAVKVGLPREDRLKLFLPEVMTKPLYLRTGNADAIKTVLKTIYDAAGGNKKLSPTEINNIMLGKKTVAPKPAAKTTKKPTYQGLDENGNAIYK